MQTIALHQYQIKAGPIAESLPAFLESCSYSRLFVLVDENTELHCLPALATALNGRPFSLIRVSAGEAHKNLDTCRIIWQQLMEQEAGRQALMLNLGGGVIGDMGGFCASTFKRGIRFVQIPTTLLAQVDASIGGKLGIDFRQAKNSIGLFKDPLAVFIDPAFLSTLPQRELRSGYAEAIKHALIADAGQWEQLEKTGSEDRTDWEGLIVPSLLIKKSIVEEDPQEQHLRKALNFGHTIGHAIEGWALETASPLLHGEAIAIGMVCEAYLSGAQLGLTDEEIGRISRYIIREYGHHPQRRKDYPSLIALMRNDKKNEADEINFSLINPIGRAVINQHCPPELIMESLDYYNSLASFGR